jgi:ribosomal protein S18 acetylase RimI-like enzyme
MEIKYGRLNEVTDERVDELNGLMKQLTPNAQVLNNAYVQRILESQTELIVATDAGRIVGCVSVAVVYQPYGTKGWIEDFVVDERYRGRGVATELMRLAVAHARSEGCVTLNLTSSSRRESAIRLYEKLGFVRRDTNVYKLDLA